MQETRDMYKGHSKDDIDQYTGVFEQSEMWLMTRARHLVRRTMRMMSMTTGMGMTTRIEHSKSCNAEHKHVQCDQEGYQRQVLQSYLTAPSLLLSSSGCCFTPRSIFL